MTVREFDLGTGQFVAGGFELPLSKQDATWIDANTLLVARDWGAGTMTASGYPFVVKRLARGQAVDQAVEVFRGAESDQVGVGSFMLTDAQGHRQADDPPGHDVLRARDVCAAAAGAGEAAAAGAGRHPRHGRRPCAAQDERGLDDGRCHDPGGRAAVAGAGAVHRRADHADGADPADRAAVDRGGGDDAEPGASRWCWTTCATGWCC